MMNNINMLIQLLQSGGNPQQIAMMLLNNNPQFKNNPIIQNALNLNNAGDVNGVKNIVDNIAKERGQNIDQLMNGLFGNK